MMINGVSVGASGNAGNWSRSEDKGQGFFETLASAVDAVDLQQTDAQSRVTELLTGEGEDVHSAMIAVQQSELSFQLMMQLRNKVVAAYQEVAHMQF